MLRGDNNPFFRLVTLEQSVFECLFQRRLRFRSGL